MRDSNEWVAEGGVDKPANGTIGGGSVWAGKQGYNGQYSFALVPQPSRMATTYAGGFVATSFGLLGPCDKKQCPGRTVGCCYPELWSHHREWFWPRTNGALSAANGQLCFSNSSLIDYLTERVKDTLRANPRSSIVSVSQNDNGEYCRDKTEAAVNAEEGTLGGAIFRAVNTIADRVKLEFPCVSAFSNCHLLQMSSQLQSVNALLTN
jgi:hypothetical protein